MSYIQANTSLNSGSYLLDREGRLFPVKIHAPSTTFMSRGIEHLCPTDAEFLYNQDLLSEEEVMVIYYYCLLEYLGKLDNISIAERVKFDAYAEMNHAPAVRQILRSYLTCPYSIEELTELFEDIDQEFYIYCKNEFVKVSVLNNYVEFRITSEDGFDWNKVIIDDCILKYNKGSRDETKYSILRESSQGYRAYFYGATLDEILEDDNMILSSELLSRKQNICSIEYQTKQS